MSRTQTPVTRARETSLLPLVPLLSGTVVGTLNNNIVNVPLREIMGALHVELSRGALVVVAFNLSLAVFMPFAGWTADRLGRRRVFIASMLAVGASSLGAALASSLTLLVAFRVLQGLSAAAILPCVMGLITDLYGQERRGRALGWWAAANGFGQTVGPPLGGVLASWLSWRWIFAPTLPIVAFAALGARRLVPKSAPRAMPLDWRGAALLTVGVALAISSVTVVPQVGIRSPLVWVLATIALGALVAFAASSRRRRAPFLDPRLIREPSFLRSSLAAFAQMFCLGATLLAVPLALTRSGHESPATVGLVVFALPATMTLLAPVAGIAAERFGTRRVLRAGMGVLVAAQLLCVAAVGGGAPLGAVLACLAAVGVGVAFVQTPAAAGATRSEAGRLGTGLGVFNLLRFAGSALGAAWVAVALSGSARYRLTFELCALVAALGLAGTWAHTPAPLE